MSGDEFEEGRAFAEFLRSLSPEEIAYGNARELERAKRDHAKFQEAFRNGSCSLCEVPLDCFSLTTPCVHWLLRPRGFTKRHFPLVTAEFGLFQIQAYLRWVANEGALAQNINDLAVEGSGKFIELTIKYGQFEWAFSCGEGDYLGHTGAASDAARPHYHFQMRVNRAAFIRYNDFHVPLSRMDIVKLEAIRTAPDKIRSGFYGGEGMSDVLNEPTIEEVVKRGIAAADEENPPIKLDSIVIAEDGSSISGDEVADLVDEARAKKVTISSLLHRLPNVRVTTIVTPGPGVVEQAPRQGGRRRGRLHPLP